MSRIGNKPIALIEGVSVEVKENNVVVVKGPKGELTRQFHKDLTIAVENGHVVVKRPSDSIEHKTIHGTTFFIKLFIGQIAVNFVFVKSVNNEFFITK